MSKRLGYFQDFKGSDMILLSCEATEVSALRTSLSAAMTHGSVFALHDFAEVSARHPVRLFFCPPTAPSRSSDGGFVWILNESEYLEVDLKLEALGRVGVGHQYFDLSQTHTTLMVSVGEYPDQWWQRDR